MKDNIIYFKTCIIIKKLLHYYWYYHYNNYYNSTGPFVILGYHDRKGPTGQCSELIDINVYYRAYT